MSVEILVDGAPTNLSKGDRFEIAAGLATDSTRILRRDWDGTDAGLTFDPGSATTLVFRRLGSAGVDQPQPMLLNRLKPLHLIYQRSRRLR